MSSRAGWIGGGFAVGSVLMARPFVHRRATLLVAVPAAALVGVLVLGVLALLVAALVTGWLDWLDLVDPPTGGHRKRRKQERRRPSRAA